jgi:glycosyltransferase involved in cell wall biosynthesis
VKGLRFLERRSPAITVIIPTYNWATVLPFSIGSVLDQTRDDFELLVIGDACTDESAKIVKSFRDRRVRWINLRTNTGHQSGPNNEGLRRAKGRYIAYLGHDDLWLPKHLELHVDAMERTGSALAISHWLTVNAAGRWIDPVRGWTHRPDNWLPPTCAVHLRNAATETGGWRLPQPDTSRDAETDLWARITDRFGPLTLVDELTCIKFPAAQRPKVYQKRPCHEQREWLSHIRGSSDAEQHVRQLAAVPIEPTDADRAIVESWPAPMRGVPATAEERSRAYREYKGLPPKQWRR